MRACATANAVFAGLVLGVMSFAACSGGQEPSPGTPLPPTEIATATPSGSPVAAPTYATPTTGAASAKPGAEGTPPRSDLVNEPPDGGVVLNNAMGAGDGATSDRLQPLIDVIKAHRDGFRRCFDARTDTSPGAKGRVVMTFNLTPEGKLEVAGVDAAQSTFAAPDVVACMTNFAKSLTYPASPRGKFTRFTYPFDFKAR